MELESLVVPEIDAAAEAGHMVQNIPKLLPGATLEERHNLLVTMLDGVYVEMKEERSVVAIKPKPPFVPISQVAISREGSEVVLVKKENPRWRHRGRCG